MPVSKSDAGNNAISSHLIMKSLLYLPILVYLGCTAAATPRTTVSYGSPQLTCDTVLYHPPISDHTLPRIVARHTRGAQFCDYSHLLAQKLFALLEQLVLM